VTKFKKFKWQKQPVNFLRLLPNIITLSALCIGCTSIRFALDAKWEHAAFCIVIAAILDGIDGRVARFLNATSTFGAELDSLCDFVNFGLSPVLITYLWIFNQYNIKLISWGVVLFFAICTALRLARFNTMALSPLEDKTFSKFHIGIPSTAGALLAILPLVNELEMKDYTGFSFHSHPFIIGIYQCIIGFLMVSTVPTFSPKNISIQPRQMGIALIFVAANLIMIFLHTWMILPLYGLAYLLSIPYSYKQWKMYSALQLSKKTE
jgi:CDP-diacylglycerol---serine O-phosphatidyltransferase